MAALCCPLFACAQPAAWVPTPTNAAGTLLGTVTVGGAAAQAGDWVAAFDETGVCAGATEMVLNDGASYVSLPIYGDDATTPDVDEGMGGGEAFTLRLWRAATGEILYHPDPEEPAALGGWSATNGAPMPGFDDPYVVYDFAWDGPTLTIECPPAEVCMDGNVYNLTATPDNGAWEGPGVFIGFASYLFDPAVAGYGTHTLTYSTADGLSASCNVTVAETLAPTLDLPLGWCQADAPLNLSPLATPQGGTWTGPGVLALSDSTVFSPLFLEVGSYPITYSVGGDCGGTATAALSVYPSPTSPSILANQGLLYAGGVAPGDSIEWWIQPEGAQLPPQPLGYSDSVFYFPSWGDFFLVEVINSYGCSSFSAPLLVDATIGIRGLSHEPLRLWRDAQGRLQSSAPLTEVRWHDARGRQLAGPQGAGPWLVHARSADGRSARQWVR